MNLHQLRIFLAVARLKSFTRAAAELRVSQPDISLHVRELEAELDLKLFDRVGKTIHLTQAGQVLTEHARRIFAQLRETEEALAELKGLRRGSLLLGMGTTIGMYLLPQALGEFRRRFPGVKIQMHMANTEEIERLVRRMEVDVGFTGGILTPSKELKVETYLEDELVLILAPHHPLARQPEIALADLAHEPFILRGAGSATRHTFEEALRRRKAAIKIGMELDSIEAIKWAVAEGLGVSVISKHAVMREAQIGLLAMRTIHDLPLSRLFYLVYHAQRALPPAARAFLALLQSAPAVPVE
jgi:DNA-binding transcriptional LysR family regulator